MFLSQHYMYMLVVIIIMIDERMRGNLVAMDMFMVYIVVMISWVCTYLSTQQVVYINLYRFLYIKKNK